MAKRKTPYSVHPGVLMTQTWVATLKEKTGRSLEDWLALVRAQGPDDESERREWLEHHYGLGTNSAWWIAERSYGRGLEDGDPELYLRMAGAYVDAMFSGRKAGLRPVYDKLLELSEALGKDVRVCPAKTVVPVYRKHVIAEVKPATLTRIDFGLALGPTRAASKRLLSTGGHAKSERITHRFALSHVGEVDGEVKRWLEAAYTRDA